MASPNIAIVDYGVGNLFNAERALNHVGARAQLHRDPEAILRADKIVLPGVGSFETGMTNLRRAGLVEVLERFRKSGKPILGICLGMQLLLSESEENGVHAGLNMIAGRVVKFRPPEKGNRRFKVPQISWNSLEDASVQREGRWKGTILEGVPQGAYMYFVHSYFVSVADPRDSLAMTTYGRDTFTSALMRDNVIGCQFHPERSGETGLAILRNFVQC